MPLVSVLSREDVSMNQVLPRFLTHGSGYPAFLPTVYPAVDLTLVKKKFKTLERTLSVFTELHRPMRRGQ